MLVPAPISLTVLISSPHGPCRMLYDMIKTYVPDAVFKEGSVLDVSSARSIWAAVFSNTEYITRGLAAALPVIMESWHDGFIFYNRPEGRLLPISVQPRMYRVRPLSVPLRGYAAPPRMEQILNGWVVQPCYI